MAFFEHTPDLRCQRPWRQHQLYPAQGREHGFEIDPLSPCRREALCDDEIGAQKLVVAAEDAPRIACVRFFERYGQHERAVDVRRRHERDRRKRRRAPGRRAIGRIAFTSPVAGVMIPACRRLSNRAASVSAWAIGTTRAISRPRSEIVTLRPCFTRRRISPSFALASSTEYDRATPAT